MAAPEPTDPAEVAAFERRLRHAGRRHQGEPGDPSLGALLEQIDRRRRTRLDALQRWAGSGTGPADPPPPSAPAGTDAGERHAPGSPGTILSIETVGAHIRIFRVAPPPAFRFRAGQYAKVGTGRGKRRSFSLASAPHDGHVELCIGRNPTGTVTPALFALSPGGRLDIDPRPRGRFGLATARTHLMVATGTGIAPLRSMVRDALHRGSTDQFVILHGASYADGLPYRDELAALAEAHDGVTYVPTVSRPDTAGHPAWTGHRGRVDALARDVARTLDRRAAHAYVCGNPAMVASLAKALDGAGFAVSTEAFD
jgi:NAD(P)H-flavin reductase